MVMSSLLTGQRSKKKKNFHQLENDMTFEPVSMVKMASQALNWLLSIKMLKRTAN